MNAWRLLVMLAAALAAGQGTVWLAPAAIAAEGPSVVSTLAATVAILTFAALLGAFEIWPLRSRAIAVTTDRDALLAIQDALHRRIAERDRDVAATRRTLERMSGQFNVALNNMRQGLCMYDANARLVVCNDLYRQMYGLDPEIIRPGCSFEDVIDQQRANGNFSMERETYVRGLLDQLAGGKVIDSTAALPNGRRIRIVQQGLPDGSWVSTHEDVTAQHQAEVELANTKNFLDTVIEHVPATILVKDARDFRYVLLNHAGEQFFGHPREQIIGKTADEFFPKAAAESIAARDKELLETGEQNFIDDRPIHNRDGIRHVTTKRLVIHGTDGEPKYLLGVIEDITELKRAEAQIAHLAHHDVLTGLPNRAAFNERLSAALAQSGDSGDSVAVLCIDLDRFKEINDVYGHATGDALLQEVAARLKSAADGCFIARLGGDEFTVISSEGPQPATAEAIAERMLKVFEEDLDIAGNSLRSGLSIGVAMYPNDASDATSLVNNADAALYRAKAQGRGSIRFFESEMDTQLRERRALQQELRSAIPNGELALHYQPLAQVGGGIIGFEALARWHHPLRGTIAPGVFIPLAEESSLIVAMGDWILREACREAASWPRPLHIAVNLSPIQFRHGDLAASVHAALLDTGLAPSRLELEITEGVLVGDFSRAVSILRRLKAMGVRIAMDDFGTGYSSLSYLQSFPFDKIKIDRAFISNVDRNSQSASIVRAVIGLGRGLHVPVAAEGVETSEQLAFLSNENCDEVQGYLLGRPRPIADYAEVLGRPATSAAFKAAG